jgi:hypothetical protein
MPRLLGCLRKVKVSTLGAVARRQLFLYKARCGQNQIWVSANGIIRVDVFELDDAIRGHQKHGWHRQLMVLLSGCGFQIDSILCQRSQGGLVHLVGYSKGLRGGHLTI